jgi:hypothetical protein
VLLTSAAACASNPRTDGHHLTRYGCQNAAVSVKVCLILSASRPALCAAGDLVLAALLVRQEDCWALPPLLHV